MFEAAVIPLALLLPALWVARRDTKRRLNQRTAMLLRGDQ